MARKTQPARSSARKREQHSPARAAGSRSGGLLSAERLKQLYTTMLQCRLIEEESQRLFKEGKIALSSNAVTGREATEVGAIIGLRPQDCIAPRKRNLVAGFVLGAPLKQVFTRLRAPSENSSSASWQAQGPSGPLIIGGAAAMAARLNIGTGVALAYKAHKKPGVVVIFSGDDSMALASWREAVDFAVAHKLPVVHVVQDDLGGESASSSIQSPTGATAAKRGLPTLIVDGNDVVAVYRVAQEAIRRARQGHGPTLIECKTLRWPGYSGIAPAQRPPLPEKRPGGNPHDPISAMEAYLTQKGLWSDAWKEKLIRAFHKQLGTALHFAERQSAKRRKLAIST